MNTEQTRNLARAIAREMPGWQATWEDHTVGAYLVNDSMRLFLSAQIGYGHKPGMVGIFPQLPSGPAWEDPDNKSNSIYVGENRSPEVFAREITRRILEAQDYPAKVARQMEAHARYQQAEDAAQGLARELCVILGEQYRGTRINAHPHGTWQCSSGSARLDVYLSRELAVKVARLLMEEKP